MEIFARLFIWTILCCFLIISVFLEIAWWDAISAQNYVGFSSSSDPGSFRWSSLCGCNHLFCSRSRHVRSTDCPNRDGLVDFWRCAPSNCCAIVIALSCRTERSVDGSGRKWSRISLSIWFEIPWRCSRRCLLKCASWTKCRRPRRKKCRRNCALFACRNWRCVAFVVFHCRILFCCHVVMFDCGLFAHLGRLLQ